MKFKVRVKVRVIFIVLDTHKRCPENLVKIRQAGAQDWSFSKGQGQGQGHSQGQSQGEGDGCGSGTQIRFPENLAKIR